MTRDEFLDNFIVKSGYPKSCRRPMASRIAALIGSRLSAPTTPRPGPGHCHYDSGERIECLGWLLVPRIKITKPTITVTTHKD